MFFELLNILDTGQEAKGPLTATYITAKLCRQVRGEVRTLLRGLWGEQGRLRGGPRQQQEGYQGILEEGGCSARAGRRPL